VLTYAALNRLSDTLVLPVPQVDPHSLFPENGSMATDAVPFAAPLSAAWSRALGVESLPEMATTGSGGEVGGQAPERLRGQAKSLTHAQQSNEERLRIRATEMDLIRDAQAGSRAAFDALVRQYEHQVLRLALHLTGSEQDAEDIYQEAFLKAYRYLNNFRFECSFYTWIYRIVTNLCLDQLRRRKTRREDSAVVLDHSGDEIDLMASVSDDRAFSNPGKELDRKRLGERIQVALETLTPRERMVFELKHYQGLRLRTIGEMLSTTEETAKNTLFRATKKLRSQLAGIR
jgi:RNA polymerase sigma-70 factor (ECF subfamily)